MNKQVHWAWGVLAFVLFAGLMASVAQAQSIKAEIPFEFVVGNKRMAEGEYTLRSLFPNTILIRKADCSSSVMVLTLSVEAKNIQDTGKLIFNQYGDQYFLSQIWTPGTDNGLMVSKSRSEREISLRAPNHEVTTVALK